MVRRVNSVLALVACIVCFLLGFNLQFRSRSAVQGTTGGGGGANAVGPTILAKKIEDAPNADGLEGSPSLPPAKKFIGTQKTRSSKSKPSLTTTANPTAEDDDNDEPTTVSRQGKPKAGGGGDGDAEGCTNTVVDHYNKYYEFSTEGKKLRKKHGPLNIAAFSRLWPPPFHGRGGMQFHAMHLYSQLAALGHRIHVFVTGPSHGHLKVMRYEVDKASLKLLPITGTGEGSSKRAQLVVEQIPSTHNAEYSELWFENCLEAFKRVNRTIPGGFQVAHSESWAGVTNIYQIGLQMAVTWHGSMLDWFRNEVNLIVHNYRMKGKMPGSVQRMSALGSSVAYEAYMLLTVPHHIVISDSAAKDLQEINLVSPERIHLIYNGVNANNFRPGTKEQRAAFLTEYHVDPNDFVVGCGGRLEGIKGHHQLSEAMDILLNKHKAITLVVAGTGGESRRYEALKHKGLKVVMLGMMEQDKLASFYQSLDVFVDPFYQHHGLNTVMIEAVLSGVPIVATRLASAQTTAPCSEYGLTFGLGEVQELADQIEKLMNDRPLRDRIAKNVRERAIHLFTSSIMAGSYEALLYNAYLNPRPLHPITGKVVCKKTYPAMCYREPFLSPSSAGTTHKKKQQHGDGTNKGEDAAADEQ